jgi:hypothetical protein
MKRKQKDESKKPPNEHLGSSMLYENLRKFVHAALSYSSEWMNEPVNEASDETNDRWR